MAEFQCPFLGVKQTLTARASMSAFDPQRTSAINSYCSSKASFTPKRIGSKTSASRMRQRDFFAGAGGAAVA